MSKHAFFLGIKGVGMTALACSMQDEGWTISGSDTDESFITDDILNQRKITVSSTLSQSYPSDVDLIIYSAAYDPPTTDIRTIPLAQALADFVTKRRVIAVAGVGGKTTTTAMLAVLLRSAGREVGYYVGTGSIPGLNAPGAAGTDPYFVIEADEYAVSKQDKRAKFELLSPQILITTNIIHDHPDIYPTESDTLDTFTKLIASLKPNSSWIYSESDPLTSQIISANKQLLSNIKLIPYSTSHPLYSELNLQVFGDHNRLDALAAILAAIQAGLPEKEALAAIGEYRGAERRQERIGEVNGRLLYDDYGHHPEEIEATIQAFRDNFPQHKLTLIFESHTYSRTESLFQEFASALSHADQVYVMPIFESAREKGLTHSVSHQGLAQAVSQLGTEAVAVNWDNAASVIAANSQPGDLLLTMGAGFVYKLHQEFKKLL